MRYTKQTQEKFIKLRATPIASLQMGTGRNEDKKMPSFGGFSAVWKLYVGGNALSHAHKHPFFLFQKASPWHVTLAHKQKAWNIIFDKISSLGYYQPQNCNYQKGIDRKYHTHL